MKKKALVYRSPKLQELTHRLPSLLNCADGSSASPDGTCAVGPQVAVGVCMAGDAAVGTCFAVGAAAGTAAGDCAGTGSGAKSGCGVGSGATG